jgi:hypothetical protein
MDDPIEAAPDIAVPEGRDRLGRAHQLRVDISIAIALAPAWLRRALGDRDATKARGARAEIVERIADAIERRFRITWAGCDEDGENARPRSEAAPLCGGPDTGRASSELAVDSKIEREHL